MANAPRGGKRLAGSSPAQNYQNTTNNFNFSNTDPSFRSDDDAVIDEILRSIAGVEFNITSAPNRTLQEPPRRTALPRSRVNPNQPPREPDPAPAPAPAPQQPEQPQTPPASGRRRQVSFPQSNENEYQAAAASVARQQAQPIQPAQPVQQVPLTPELEQEAAAGGLRDTQVFRPARPAKRDTDRLPTLVDDDPKKHHPVLNRILTLFVVVLVLAALVLGTKMLYILGPSMGLDLPDLSNVPVISNILGMIPDAEEKPIEMPTEPDEGITEEALPDPTSVTLDADELTLAPGETKVLTATLDVEGWQGLLAWASSDKNEQVIKLTVLGPNTAQVEYMGEGKCAVAVQVGVTPADESAPPHATCYIECLPDEAEPATEPEEFETDAESEGDGEGEGTAEAVTLKLKSEDFTLKVGEGYQVASSDMDPSAVTWTTSNESIATVSGGNVYAIAAGNATITATAPDGSSVSAVCRVKSAG